MKKNIVWIFAFVSVLLFMIAGWAAAYYFFQRLSKASMELKLEKFTYEQAESKIQNLENELSSRESENEILINSITSLQGQLDSAYQTIEVDTEKYAKQIADLSSDFSQLSLEVKTLRQKTVCSQEPFPFHFDNNAKISQELKEFIGDVDGNVEKASWDVIWNNSKAAVHEVNGEYKYVFIVYFDEGVPLDSIGIFWVDKGCWLSLAD